MHFEVVGFLSCWWYRTTIPPPYIHDALSYQQQYNDVCISRYARDLHNTLKVNKLEVVKIPIGKLLDVSLLAVIHSNMTCIRLPQTTS
jgi:hypothetical protein